MRRFYTLVLFMLSLAFVFAVFLSDPVYAETADDESPVDLVKVESADGTAHYVAVPKEGVTLPPEEETSPYAAPYLAPVIPETTNEADASILGQPADTKKAQPLQISQVVTAAAGLGLVSYAVFYGMKRLRS